MRAVCTRGRFEGGWKQLACVCICAHTRGGSRIPFLFLSARRRKEYILARRSFNISAGRSFFSTLRQSFFCLASFFSFPFLLLFFKPTTLFSGPRAPPRRKGVETAGEREGRNRSSPLHSRDSQPDSLLFLSLLSCACILQFLLLQSCNCARCKVD